MNLLDKIPGKSGAQHAPRKPKRPDQQQYRANLFGNPPATEDSANRDVIPPSDPNDVHWLQVDIDQIDLYNKNPRRQENTKFRLIKDSIRDAGLKDPITITRRPGDQKYTVKAGGNTRLRAIKELWHETQDPIFKTLTKCFFEPWVSEAEALTGHLIENDNRADLTFIDRALSIHDVRLMLQEEAGEDLSQRGLSKALSDRGYKISQPMISKMDYAREVLFPVIPYALESGMGKHMVENFQKLDRVTKAIWDGYELGSEDAYRAKWNEVIIEHNDPDLGFDLIERDLCDMLVRETDQDVQRIRIEFDMRKNGHPGPFDDLHEKFDPEQAQAEAEKQWGHDQPKQQRKPRKSVDQNITTKDGPGQSPVATTPKWDPKTPTNDTPDPDSILIDTVMIENRAALLSGAAPYLRKSENDPKKSVPTALEELRSEAARLASAILKPWGFQRNIIAVENGCGYILEDLATKTEMKLRKIPEENQVTCASLLWHLFALSQVTTAPWEYVKPFYETESALYELLSGKKSGQRPGDDIICPHPGDFGYQLWGMVTEDSWEHLMALHEVHRQMARWTIDNQTSLWSKL